MLASTTVWLRAAKTGDVRLLATVGDRRDEQ
jgi:hypothetical protein